MKLCANGRKKTINRGGATASRAGAIRPCPRLEDNLGNPKLEIRESDRPAGR